MATEFEIERRRYATFGMKTAAPHMKCLQHDVKEFNYLVVPIIAGSIPFFEDGTPFFGIISDDLGESDGPKDFDVDAMKHAFAKASAVVIVSGPLNIIPYDLAAQIAVGHKVSVVIVETEMSREMIWTLTAQAINPAIYIQYWTFSPQGSA